VKSSTYCPPVYEESQEVHEDAPHFFGVGLFVEVSVQIAKLWREVGFSERELEIQMNLLVTDSN